MIKTISLKEEEKDYEIDFNPEQPYLKILKIELESEDHTIESFDVRVQYKIVKSDSREESGPVSVDHIISPSNLHEEFFIDNSESFSLQYRVQKANAIPNIGIKVTYATLKRIDISNPLTEFDKHLSYSGNNKIIFSAPFGHGKSTFLDVFFEEKEEQYNVFKVFPVNYSVANNQDIFRYIKTDILFQLLAYDLDFEKNDVSLSFAAQELLLENIPKVISTSLQLYFSLDKSNALLGAAIQKLEQVLTQVKKRKDEINKGEEEVVSEYLKEVYEREGSIYEDNLYSQLIRMFLEQIKTDNDKKNVLVIEDLDRMDPEHIFRILNIISAHFDTYRQNDFEESNKFGFDKIIVVGDLNNLEHLFAHKYGNEVDFSGYINKFFSTEPFHYDNKKMFNVLIDDFLDKDPRIGNLKQHWERPFNLLFGLLIKGNQLSLRDLVKISHCNLSEVIDEIRKNPIGDRHSVNGLFMPVIAVLSKVLSRNQLISKIENCKLKKIEKKSADLREYCPKLIAPIGDSIVEPKYKYAFSVNTKLIRFNVNYGDNITESIIINSFVKNEGNGMDIHAIIFTWNDFYDLMIENVKKYYQITEGGNV